MPPSTAKLQFLRHDRDVVPVLGMPSTVNQSKLTIVAHYTVKDLGSERRRAEQPFRSAQLVNCPYQVPNLESLAGSADMLRGRKRRALSTALRFLGSNLKQNGLQS